nr:hypothetical protein [Nanoarchaeota archaeon]
MIKNLGIRNFLLLLFLFSAILPFFVLGAPISMKVDESSLYIARTDGTIEVWNKSSGSLIKSFSNEIEAWSFETDGTKFYIGSEDAVLHVFDLATGARDKINLSLTSSAPIIFSLKLDKDSQLLYAGLSDGNIIVINTPDLSIAKIIGKHERPVAALMLDEVYLYSVSLEGVIKVWDRPALVLLKNITIQAYDEETARPTGNIRTAIIEDSKVYMAYTLEKIRIWDLTTDSLLKEVNAHPGGDVMAIVSDGEY